MNGPHARFPVRRDSLGAKRDRLRIAQIAARLIAEHGLTDWTLAKRKALRQLLLPDSTALPSNDEIEAALTEHHALFGGDAHAAALRRQRIEALAWMRRLAAWDPVLVGGVAAGWATEHSEVRLELVADDAKGLEMELAGHGVGYGALPPREGDATTVLRVESKGVAVRLSVVTPIQRRNRSRKPDEPRLSADALATLIDGETVAILPAGDSA